MPCIGLLGTGWSFWHRLRSSPGDGDPWLIITPEWTPLGEELRHLWDTWNMKSYEESHATECAPEIPHYENDPPKETHANANKPESPYYVIQAPTVWHKPHTAQQVPLNLQVFSLSTLLPLFLGNCPSFFFSTPCSDTQEPDMPRGAPTEPAESLASSILALLTSCSCWSLGW